MPSGQICASRLHPDVQASLCALLNATQPFSWDAEASDEATCSPTLLRGLFAADQQLLQVDVPSSAAWDTHFSLSRVRRRPRGQQQQSQQHDALAHDTPLLLQQQLEAHSHGFECDAALSKQQLPIVQLRVLSHSDTAASSFASRSSSLIDARRPSVSSCHEPALTRHGSNSTTAPPCSLGAARHLHEHADSTSTAHDAAGAGDDVAAQKAAAQARFAQQQAVTQAPRAALLDPVLLQQELSRLLQHGVCPRVFCSMLLSNLLCCLVVVAAKGSVGRWVAGSALQWPLLLSLSGCLGWLFMGRLKPLHFADAALEQHYAERSQYGRCLLDLWFSLAGCSGVLAAVRSDADAAGAVRTAAGPLAALQALVPLALLAVLLSAVLLLLMAPRVYRAWREQLVFVGKVAMVSGLVALQLGSCALGSVALEQHAWLGFLRHAPQQAQAASVMLAMGAVQAFLLLTLMVRVSAYMPMQLIHVTALLVSVASSGSSGLSMVRYAVQLLACGLWVPTGILVQLELSARRAFLTRHLPQKLCPPGPTVKLAQA